MIDRFVVKKFHQMRDRQRKSALSVMHRLHFFSGCTETSVSLFSAIERRLKDDRFGSLLDWIDSIESTIRNLEAAATSPNYVILARHARRVFAKQCQRHQLFTMETWCDHAAKVREKVVTVMESAPPNVKARASPILTKLVRQRHHDLITDRELQNFVRATEKLKDDDDHQELIRIVREGEEHLELSQLNISVDLSQLKLSTVRKLEAYVKKALAAKGLEYPE
jgi:hypothetical protein